MVYRTFHDMKLSGLGFGAMRLPLIPGTEDEIDEDKVREMVSYAMAHGVNYYDTAYGYLGGNSEPVMGRILSEYPRDSFYLATKYPGYDPANISAEKGREIFNSQLERCQVDYFDFYLFHNVNANNIENYLADEENGLASYIIEQKKNGKIRNLGFSVHANYDMTKRFLEAYGEHIDFCQIQCNWIDYDYQQARRKIELLDEYGIPIWIMEPLRGGKLAQLPDKYVEKLGELRPDESIPGWGFRFIQTFPHVGMTLSGMSSLEQVKQNVDIFESEKPLNTQEWDVLMRIADEMREEMVIPCTTCRYCTTYCPQQIDIPRMLALYNDQVLGGTKLWIPDWMLETVPPEKQPGSCLGCRSCETVCPQEIKISEVMARFAESILPIP